MTDKQKFGVYIASKRKNKKLTQEELAEKLFVNPTTVSKWERGITYPDISMISNLCKELNISEHEFFTACDDLKTQEKMKDAKKYNILTKTFNYIFVISYLIAILTCFICNMAIDHELSWFYIVLVSILLSFSITSLPYYLKSCPNRWIISLLVASILIYVLLFVCNNYLLGDWLLNAYLITTFELVMVWIAILSFRFLKVNYYLKTAILLVLIATTTLFTNVICDSLFGGSSGNLIYNFLAATILICISVFLAIQGTIKQLNSKTS